MPERKYFSEFGLNMFGTFCALLQQDQLEHAITGFGVSHPCHIYMIGRRPRIMLDPESVKFEGEVVKGRFLIHRGFEFEPYAFEGPNLLGSSNLRLVCPYPHTEFWIYNEQGELVSGGKTAFMAAMFGPNYWHLLSLEILYIGQSYGVEGARVAPERLKNHSTLQNIYAEAIRRAPDQEVWLSLWSFEQLMLISLDGTQKTFERTLEEDDEHVKTVLTKGITEQQQINFTEAALIQYFEPEYNKTFKGTFPNPAHKTYSECYDLDINTVAVEIQTEELMCQFWSPKVAPKWTHIAAFLLHSTEERKSMFDIS